MKNRTIMCALIVLAAAAAICTAQEATVTDLYNKVAAVVEKGEHPGMMVFQMRKQLEALTFEGRDNLPGGILCHHAQLRDKAIASLTAFMNEFPDEVTPEVVAALAVDCSLTNRLQEAERYYALWNEKYPGNGDSFRFSIYQRMVDEIDLSLLVCYSRVGTIEQVLAQIDHMIAVRDRDKPESYPSSTIFKMGTEFRTAQGLYDEAIEFITAEVAKQEPGSVMYEYALLAKAKAEYEKIAAEQGYEAAYKHFVDAGTLFNDQYAQRQYNSALQLVGLEGKPMTELNVSDWLIYDPAVEQLKGKVIVLELFTST